MTRRQRRTKSYYPYAGATKLKNRHPIRAAKKQPKWRKWASDHKTGIAIAILLSLLFGASMNPMFPDPYYHVERVNFWEWCRREIDELLHGEKKRNGST
jgi:hypothetical protein